MKNDETSNKLSKSYALLESNTVSSSRGIPSSSKPLVTSNNSALESGMSVESFTKVSAGSSKQVLPENGFLNFDKIGETKNGQVRECDEVGKNDVTKPLKWDPEVLDSLVSYHQ